MCGAVSSVEPSADGALALQATRFPAYVSGLRGLVADVPPHPAGKVLPYEPAADEDLTVIIRVDLDARDFEIGDQKTLASIKGDTGRLRVQVWNMGDTAKTGRIDVAGAKLEGLPETIALGPRGSPPVEFDCVLSPSDASPEGELVLTGVFEGRRSSRLVMRTRFEKRFLDACVATPIDWRNPEDWARNDSAQSFRASWDEAEQALRFDVAWTNLYADRWFYPVYTLKLPQESLEGAVALRFEVKCAQNKVENDFNTQNLMLLRADKTKPPISFIPFNAPVGDWEKRYAELSNVNDLADVTAFRLGANPRGTQCTLWIRNLEILKRRRCAYTPDVLARPRLRGVMSPGGNMTEDDFKTLHEWGATLLRFQMVRDWHGVNGNQDLDEYDRWLEGRLDHFDAVVLPLARKYGVMVVLDLHVPPGGYDASHEANMFHDAKYADHFVELWHRIARRFRGREGIYGYDLVNEPLQDREAAPGCDFPTLMRRAAEAVRAEDPTMPIIIESNHCGSPAFFEDLEPLPFVNVIYQLHFYSPWEFTHQRVLNARMWTVEYPDESHGWNRGYIDWSLMPVKRFQEKYGAKIYAGEFSAVAWAPGAGNYLRDCISVFEDNGWDWTYHAFREWSGWSVEHEGEDDASLRPASSDTPRKQALLEGFRR